jgi:hypothetical protein
MERRRKRSKNSAGKTKTRMGEGNQVGEIKMEKIIHRSNIVEYKDFISQEECQRLIGYFNSSEQDWNLSCFYESYTMDPLAPINKTQEFERFYFDNDLRNKLKKLAEQDHPKKLKNLSLSAHKWGTGASARKHSDNSELDGTPNGWHENKFVTILYLNDNYTGGALRFDDHKITISPRAGTVIAFDPGIENIHSVTEVRSGIRYTMLASWDYEDSKYSEEYIQEKIMDKENQKTIQENQKRMWIQGNKNA